MSQFSDEILEQFQDWLKMAEKSEPNDPTAMCLSTIGADGFPDSRMVLARIIDSRGIAFFTNYNSKKGEDILQNPKAALCFHWKSLRKQIRVSGTLEKTSDEESDNYYNSRARQSRIGAWASEQSQKLESREILLNRVAEFEEKFKGLEHPPRPKHWSGFRLMPHRIEFWQDGEFRLHEREVFEFKNNAWERFKLYP